MEALGTPYVCTVDENGAPDLTVMPAPPKDIDRNFAPAGRLIDPDEAARRAQQAFHNLLRMAPVTRRTASFRVRLTA